MKKRKIKGEENKKSQRRKWKYQYRKLIFNNKN